MFESTVKINGNTVIHIYGHNETLSGYTASLEGKDTYKYEYHEMNASDEEVSFIAGHVNHVRDEGLSKLMLIVYTDIERKRKALLKKSSIPSAMDLRIWKRLWKKYSSGPVPALQPTISTQS